MSWSKGEFYFTNILQVIIMTTKNHKMDKINAKIGNIGCKKNILEVLF